MTHPSPDEAVSAFDAIDVLGDYWLLDRRSPTLEGSVPVKAVQFCPPFIQGNTAGFHLWPGESTLLRKGRNGLTVGLTETAQAQLTTDYAARIARLADDGLLERGGYWHRKLSAGAYWGEGRELHLWTGYLVRPRPGVWLLVTGAFNRRSPVAVREHVLADPKAFVPLVVTLDVTSVGGKDTWLEKEVASVLPLRPDVTFTSCAAGEEPEIDRAYIRHLAARATTFKPGTYNAIYRKLTKGEPSAPADGPAACRLVVTGGPDVHEFRTFKRFATPKGWSKTHPAGDRLQYLDVRNIFDIEGAWDGHALRELKSQTPRAVRRLFDVWSGLYGDEFPELPFLLESYICRYAFFTHGPRIGEPYMSVVPWVLVRTPPGWSSVVDGPHRDGIDAMRGVISTDQFHFLPDVWHFLRPLRFKIPRGVPLTRVLPAPRDLLLHAGFRRVPFAAGAH
jgi:hypothetical protein